MIAPSDVKCVCSVASSDKEVVKLISSCFRTLQTATVRPSEWHFLISINVFLSWHTYSISSYNHVCLTPLHSAYKQKKKVVELKWVYPFTLLFIFAELEGNP